MQGRVYLPCLVVDLLTLFDMLFCCLRSFGLASIFICSKHHYSWHDTNLMILLNFHNEKVVVCLNLFNFTTSDAYCGEIRLILRVSTMSFKLEIRKFSGDNKFGLWKVMMQTILTQEKCVEALKSGAAMPTREILNI